MEKNIYKIGKELFITNDEEIKEGDCILLPNNEIIILPTGLVQIPLNNFIRGYSLSDCKKIISTTDQDLIKDGIQAIPDEFLEWFVKNPSCEEVEVEIESKFDRVDGHYHDVWEIIIPKEEPKQELERGIKITHVGKQETLEEAKKYAELSYYGDEVDAFVRGAKWQQEQDKNKYSEEEVKKVLLAIELVNPKHLTMLRSGYGEFPDSYELTEKGVNYIIEQFKKK
jgi:hypothetical protein